ncbi:hypothetical protein [Nocardioides pakistanensis]
MATTLTRTQIAQYVGPAFGDGGVRTSELLAAATSAQAPPAVLERLNSLPERTIPHLRELWRLMPEVPVE